MAGAQLPLAAVEEAVAADLLALVPARMPEEIEFPHPLVRAAVCDDLSPTLWRATTPMRVFAQDTAGSTLQSTQAFRVDSPAWNFFMMVGDPYKSGMLAVEDQLGRRIAGYMACSGGRTVQKVWENDSLKPSAGAAIDYKTGQLYVDDRRCRSHDHCRLFLVVLDLRTGRELARVAVKGTKPSIGQIFIGPHAVYYTATDTDDPNGYVTRVTAARG